MHLDINFGLQVLESSFLVSVLFKQTFSHSYLLFQILLNVFFCYWFPFFVINPYILTAVVSIGWRRGIKIASANA